MAFALTACGREPAVSWTAAERAQIASLSLSRLGPPPADPTNAVADDPRAAALGERLFHDRALSRNGAVSCAHCHQPARHFTDGLPLSIGQKPVRRHAPSLLGAAHSPWLFWDGRADSLWSQVTGPLEDPNEHGLSRTEVAQHIVRRYRAEYEALFGALQGADATRVVTDAGKALAAFERTLRPKPARFDAFADGDANALTPAEQRGLKLFVGRAQCVRCHHGPLLTNHGFHNTGLGRRAGSPTDRGRDEGIRLLLASGLTCKSEFSDDQSRRCPQLDFLRSGAAQWLGAFKTPTLRNVAATAPYMHDGRFATLDQVLDHYNRAPQVDMRDGHTELFPLGLQRHDLADLEAFLRTLTGD